MNKYLLLITVASTLFLFSCKKSDKVKPAVNSEKKYEVVFTASEFVQKVNKFNNTISKVDSAKTGASHIVYLVYDQATGSFVKKITQQANDNEFGTIRDSLPVGKYLVTFLASNLDFSYLYTDTFWNSYLMYENGEDLFVKKDTIEVAGVGINEDIVLSRKIGKLTLTLTDKIPANVNSISVTYYGLRHYYFNQDERYFNSVPRISQYTISELDRFNPFTRSINILIPGKSSVSIKAYSESGELLVEKAIADVAVYQNKETVLSGSLFAPDQPSGTNSGFTILLDKDWDTDKVPHQF